jgi:hypothetical protein
MERSRERLAVMLETGGHVSIARVLAPVIKIMTSKLRKPRGPSLPTNLELLRRPHDEFNS